MYLNVFPKLRDTSQCFQYSVESEAGHSYHLRFSRFGRTWLEVMVGAVWLQSQAFASSPHVAPSDSEQYVYTALPVAQLMYMSAGVAPCVMWICARGGDGTGVRGSVSKSVAGLQWRPVHAHSHDPVIASRLVPRATTNRRDPR